MDAGMCPACTPSEPGRQKMGGMEAGWMNQSQKNKRIEAVPRTPLHRLHQSPGPCSNEGLGDRMLWA